jgi:type I restriction enzyme M protein
VAKNNNLPAPRLRQAGGIPFEEKMSDLSATLYEQFAKADELETTIRKNLEALGYGG